MVAIPIDYNTTQYKLDIEPVTLPSDRDYFGMSYLGNDCKRSIQYTMRLAAPITVDSRLNRIFQVGRYFEDLFYSELKRIGIIVTDKQTEIIGFESYWKGHIDGIAFNVPEAPKTKHLLELKTHKASMFKQLKKTGVEVCFPGYYKQIQRYMAGLSLTHGLYVGMNKDTCDLYIERIYENKEIQEDLLSIEIDLTLEKDLYPRIGTDNISWYQCKMCMNKDVCFGYVEVANSCRSCKHCSLIGDGGWFCDLLNKNLSFKEQKEGCPHHEYSTMFTGSSKE